MMETKLHIGCFNTVVDGWYNTDITPHLWIARVPGAPFIFRAAGLISEDRYQDHREGVFRRVHYLNVTKRFPYVSERFEAAFSSHVLEHIELRFVPQFFAEVFRVLRPGGIFRVVVPSLELAIRSFEPDAPEQCLQLIFENGHRNAKNTHKWMYTEQSLARVFQAAGFVDVAPRHYLDGRLPDLEKLDNRSESSIYVEGRKPLTHGMAPRG